MGGFDNIYSEVFVYVDDVRLLGWCNRECWNAIRYFDSRCRYISIKYTLRKIKGPDHRQGPWKGSIIHTTYGMKGMISQDKWDMTKKTSRELFEMLNHNACKISRTELLSHCGFIVY